MVPMPSTRWHLNPHRDFTVPCLYDSEYYFREYYTKSDFTVITK